MHEQEGHAAAAQTSRAEVKRGMDWYRIKIDPQNSRYATVEFRGDIGPELGNFSEALNGAERIICIIDSPGGVVRSAFRFANLLQARDSIALVTNRCFSAAVTIALACKRVGIAERARMMIHRGHHARSPTQDDIRQLAFSNWAEVTLVCRRTGLPRETVQEWFDQEKYFTAREAVEVGLADFAFRASDLSQRV